MPASRLRSLRRLVHRSLDLRESLRAHAPTPPLPPAVFPSAAALRVPTTTPSVSCTLVPDALSFVRHRADLLVEESLHRWRAFSSRSPTMAVLGDAVLLFRSTSLDPTTASRVVRHLQRKALPPRASRSAAAAGRGAARSGGRVVTRLASPVAAVHAATGMGLVALAAHEQRVSSGPVSLLRILSSTDGPQQLGIGWIPKPIRILLANFALCATLGAAVWLVVLNPVAVPWLVTAAAVLFAARPDLDSFRRWTRQTAPKVAQRKALLVDKIRTTVAPYMMALRPPVLDDYALFSVVTVVDHADYVYVYAGVLGRWCLLGWYNIADDYNFDKIRAMPLE